MVTHLESGRYTSGVLSLNTWSRVVTHLESAPSPSRDLRPPPSLLQEFHETLHSLLLGLAQVEGRLQACSALDARAPRSALLAQRQLLTVSHRAARGGGPTQGLEEPCWGSGRFSVGLEMIWFVIWID